VLQPPVEQARALDRGKEQRAERRHIAEFVTNSLHSMGYHPGTRRRADTQRRRP
jgi:hypothetical protein